LLAHGDIHSIGVMLRPVFGAVFALIFALVIVLALAAQTAGAAPQAAAELLDVPRLLDELSHTDTAVRKGASEKLAAIGEAARPELIKAARSDDPEQRARAAELLRKLPWFTNSDAQPIRALLERYGPADDRTRMALLWQFSDMTGGIDVLLRLLGEEPNQGIRWFIAALLINERDLATHKKLLALDPPEGTVDDAPVLVLVGSVLSDRNRRKALDYFRRAIDAEERHPGIDIGVLAIAFDALTDDCLARGDLDGAAALLRRQVPRDDLPHMAYRRSFGQSEPHALARLMALHTYFGPLRDYDDDIRAWGDAELFAAPLRWRIALLIGRFGAAPPLPWQPRELTGEQHLAAGAFLLRNKLHFAAESELHKALPARAKQSPFILEANALFALGQSTADRGGDDDVAANYLERAMEVKRNNGMDFAVPSRRQDDDVWAEIHWRRARAAHARGDAAVASARVKDLLQLLPTNTDLTISMIEWLKANWREADAKVLFDKVLVQTTAKLESAADADKPGMKNDLAWLCARVDERLPEAMKLAQEAADAQPDNAAFLDTLAEVCFRAGKPDDAIRHEMRASALEPDNAFMKQQLVRFRGAGK
jgi:tetratricopeptide (TPR) repeat protein